MPDIEGWMKKFRERWIAKDIDGVIELFADDVEYFETPYQEIEDLEALREEWKSIRNQEDINLSYEIYSRDGSKFTVKWDLKYSQDQDWNHLKGIYLIELNEENKCVKFWQYLQSE
jgi:hypothetical protein